MNQYAMTQTKKQISTRHKLIIGDATQIPMVLDASIDLM